METVLITGGTGLVGTSLSKLLAEKGYAVAHLSRSSKGKNKFKTYKWSIGDGFIEPEAIATADYIVHLAGANIADKRWTNKRKQVLISSRVDSTNLLYRYLQDTPHKVKAFIGASGVNYYPNSGEKWLKETDSPGTDFLATLCQAWEKGHRQMQQLDIRTVVLRIGVVLSKLGGALPKTDMTMKLGVGGYFGDGGGYFPWIHMGDLCEIILHSIENGQMKGAYNSAAPNPVLHREFVKAIGKAMNKRTLLLPAPEFVLRLGLGELADALMTDVRTSSGKLEATGFRFTFPEVIGALQDIYKK